MKKEINGNETPMTQEHLLNKIAHNYLEGQRVDPSNEHIIENETPQGYDARIYLLKNEANRKHLAHCIRDYINGHLVKVLVDDHLLIDFTETANNDHTHFKSLNGELIKHFNRAIRQIKGEIPFDEDNHPVPLYVRRISEGGFKVLKLDEIHRLVYKEIDHRLIIISCYYHTV
ncbi:type II toxin-antitoxin system YoeB family toxin [Staphylococcus simulans]|uniref:type II toxin-antitoxin system YoeB family toxin n=1 Tax=Staphylococcus simulans TaxID=1286 RepID=UPI0021D2EC57|nr:type II toxin-antitoxin system YoeB family toxin [Staphylococcus simulans]UXV43387.1 type II toxin-antitoxin system YoeB family toxin [Staphylococcus simulans]